MVDHMQLDDMTTDASFAEVFVPMPMEHQPRLLDVSIIRTLVW